MMATSRETGRFVQVGYKKMFVPAYEKAKEITERPEFGGVTQLLIRYPQAFPPPETRYDLANTPLAVSMLDHVCHPLAILQLLGGDAATMSYLFEPRTGGVIATFTMRNGAIAAWHSTGGHASRAPLERVEIVGQRAEIHVDNTVRLTYYRPAPAHYYGRVGSFVADDEGAALHWEPEFSLGVLYNDNAFFLGYVPEVRAFCQSVLTNTPPAKAGLRDTWLQVQIYEAFRHPAGQVIELQEPPVVP
jgi:predicted dehydrogenase